MAGARPRVTASRRAAIHFVPDPSGSSPAADTVLRRFGDLPALVARLPGARAAVAGPPVPAGPPGTRCQSRAMSAGRARSPATGSAVMPAPRE